MNKIQSASKIGGDMAKQGREGERRDIWLTIEDQAMIEALIAEMEANGEDYANQKGGVSLSKVVRYALKKATKS